MTSERERRLLRPHYSWLCAVTILAALIGTSGVAEAQNPNDPNALDRQISEAGRAPAIPHMPESRRAAIDKVIVISGDEVRADQEVDGTYGRATPGLVGGMDAGSRMGTITREIGGVPISLPIPGTALPGAILGGLAGVTMREIQEFRDELTRDLVESDSPPLRSDGLALDAFWGIRRLDHLESHLFSPTLEVPEDADALLKTRFDELSIDVQGKEAIITTSVVATVHLPSEGRDVYRTVIRYRDRDTLGNWTANDKALWHSYMNFARYYLGRELAADVFGRVDLEQELTPEKSVDTKLDRKNRQRVTTDSVTPTLAWTLKVNGGNAYGSWVEAIDPARVRYDIEVFDDRQLVYDAQAVGGLSHRLSYPLEPCSSYRWSVRPVYDANGSTRFGEWMRFDDATDDEKASSRKKSKKQIKQEAEAAKERAEFGKGLIGRQASLAPAYTQDFAELSVACNK